jgi:hypothetical protein
MGQSDAILSVPFFLSFAHTRQVPVTFVAAVRPSVSIGSAPTGRIFVKFVKTVKIRRQTRNLVAIGQKYRALCPEDISTVYCCRRH